jgi:outer membrane protein TolC
MSDFFKLLQEADIASLELERAKYAIDESKEAWEKAKEEYEDARKALEKVLFKADEMAIPRQRIRKLIDDRTQALVASGLIATEAKSSSSRGTTKAPKKPKAAPKKTENTPDKAASPELN